VFGLVLDGYEPTRTTPVRDFVTGNFKFPNMASQHSEQQTLSLLWEFGTLL